METRENKDKDIEKLKQFETYDEFVEDMEKSTRKISPLSYMKWLIFALLFLVCGCMLFGMLLNLLF